MKPSQEEVLANIDKMILEEANKLEAKHLVKKSS